MINHKLILLSIDATNANLTYQFCVALPVYPHLKNIPDIVNPSQSFTRFLYAITTKRISNHSNHCTTTTKTLFFCRNTNGTHY